MDPIEKLVRRVRGTRHGFTDIAAAAEELLAAHTDRDVLRMAKALLASDVHQARMLATFLLGALAARSPESLRLLRRRVGRDADWRVQEILARAFDRYCADVGYEAALPVLRAWLRDPVAGVRRAPSEGLRVWTSRPYFREHPAVAVALLGRLRRDPSEAVRTSAGNALRDISRRHADLVRAELERWDASDERTRQTLALAGRFLGTRARSARPARSRRGAAASRRAR